MSEQSEPRLDVELPVRVFGMGSDGRPFVQHATARNISRHGAKLFGLETHLKPGDIIGVQVADQKARCKVVWVVNAGDAQKISVGVNLVEGQSCPWEKDIQQSRQIGEPAPRIVPSEDNKRKFTRHRVPFPLELRDEDGVGSHMSTQTADISARGCYIETMLPFAIGKALHITLWLDSERVRTPAVVRSCDGGFGMGIEFTGLDDATRERLQRQIEAMAAESAKPENAQGAG